MNIQEILEKHEKWVNCELDGLRANLREANLREANLREANLEGASLYRANLREANLKGADLQRANLEETNLRGANLEGANLYKADLRKANLREANLKGADLQRANLEGANLREANLKGADLQRANLEGANLSNASGLLVASQWLSEKFQTGEKGYFVYKALGSTYFNAPDYWNIESGSVLEEVVNRVSTDTCGCGVNFATMKWIEKEFFGRRKIDIWLCLIHWKDLPDVVVPYNTDGKARCGRLELLEKVKEI